MCKVETQEMTPEFMKCWQAAGMHIDEQVQGGMQSWLKTTPLRSKRIPPIFFSSVRVLHPLDPAHLRVEVAFKRVGHRDNCFEVGPTQLCP